MIKSFSDSAVLHFGWQKMKEHIVFFMTLLAIILGTEVVILFFLTAISQDSLAFAFFIGLLYFAFALLIGTGFIKIILDIAEGKKPEIKTLFLQGKSMLPFLGVIFLYALVVVVGLFLFLIPGVIWGLKYYLAPFLVIDKHMGPIEAMKKSAELTQEKKWDIFGFLFTVSVIQHIGFLVFIVGALATIPTTMVATAKMYKELS